MSSPSQISTRLATYLQSLQRFGIAPGLERITALLKSAGNPQRNYPVILVGGTNGKGSTCEFLARMLAQDGKKVGLYTSPHLYQWNERIRVLEAGNSKLLLFPGEISHFELDRLFHQALPHIEKVAATELGQPTEFEVVTFLGLWHFARQNVDVVVVEVGLGGKWDATNVTQPIVSVITHVALDHCDRLGNTLEEIARDKVHIARADGILVTAETNPGVLRVFQEHCEKIKCEIQRINLQATDDFQQINLQTAQAAYGVLCESLDWLPNSKSAHGVGTRTQNLSVPGRFEMMGEKPRVILDGANNPDGARVLATQLRSTLAASPGAGLILVLGILEDKDYAAMTEVLAPLADAVIATQSHSPRAASAELVAEQARRFCARVEQSTPVQAALERALEIANENDIVCVTGSFYTISEVGRDAFAVKAHLP